MLAALPREQVRALYPDASAFADRTGRGPRRPGELREVLREVRAAATPRGRRSHARPRSVGVAVLDPSAGLAAIAVTYADDGRGSAAHGRDVAATIGGHDAAAFAALVADAAAGLARRLYGSGVVSAR